MSRLEKRCPEDCARCELLERGEVEMVPCLLDQIAARQRRTERWIADVKRQVEKLVEAPMGIPQLAGNNNENNEK